MSLITIKSLEVPLNDIFNDLIQENKRLEEEFEFADKCLSVLMEFKDLLIRHLKCETNVVFFGYNQVKEQELSADGLKLLIADIIRYVETVAEKKSKDKNKSNSSTDIQLYHSLFNKSAEEVNDVFEDLIEYNKQLQRNMINANKQLEIVIKIYDRFSLILDTIMSSDNQITSLKLSSEDIFTFITLNEELEQLFQQSNCFDEAVDDNCAQLETTDTSDSSQDEIQDLDNTDEISDENETIIALSIRGETASDQDIIESLDRDIDDIEEIIENIPIGDENNWSQEVIHQYGDNNDLSNCQMFHNDNNDDSIASNDHLESNESLRSIFTCPKIGCFRTFSKMNSLLSHKRLAHFSHKKLTRDFCHKCKVPLLSRTSFYAHKNIHSAKFKCNICNFRAPFLSGLNRHYESHDIGSEISDSVRNVKQTIEPKTTVDEAQPMNLYPYRGCDRKFSSQKALSTHKSKDHRSKKKAIYRICRICQTPTFSTAGFHNHMNVHYGKFKCDRCDFRTGSSFYLKNHNCQKPLFAVSANEDIVDNELSTESVPQVLQDNDGSEPTYREVSTQTTIDKQIYETDEDLFQVLMSESSKQNETIAESSGLILYKCPDQRCFFESNSKKEFINHRNSHFRNKISHKVLIFRCNICSSAYTSKKSLQRHKMVHSYIWCGLNGCQFRATETKELAKHKRNSHNI